MHRRQGRAAASRPEWTPARGPNGDGMETGDSRTRAMRVGPWSLGREGARRGGAQASLALPARPTRRDGATYSSKWPFRYSLGRQGETEPLIRVSGLFDTPSADKARRSQGGGGGACGGRRDARVRAASRATARRLARMRETRSVAASLSRYSYCRAIRRASRLLPALSLHPHSLPRRRGLTIHEPVT